MLTPLGPMRVQSTMMQMPTEMEPLHMLRTQYLTV